MSAVEPAAKKAKTDEVVEEENVWTLPEHAANINAGVDKEFEGKSLTEIADGPVACLQGLGEVAEEMMEAVKVSTVRDLADWKFGKWACALVTLAELEEDGKRPAGSTLNVNNMLDKACETKSFKEIVELPVSSLQGITETADAALTRHHVDTIKKLGTWKYIAWARAIVDAAALEDTMSPEQRKRERELKKLA
mmetsp:Transcript_10087/g.17741  ORF Transcript_10087/g.17741 Transcript_10087/m.17741 type:complete len:194 (-) Transcript_10087:104-685(-)|eukprot:CAMPEP_0184519886 /NCGR_PEP_ID=MMETSP0198_2-20121128/6869_1 /TAXON_ID=1112570 /ORGANISM="Thraustochytrium sp., Strain LLF1b" /LENGTH=193 /DNA_ID=CAMNT_0026910439 /DNA_START=89 /DNA_END=670 /DNA_ORIENTATION=+